MKPADLFIGAVDFFAVIVPGSILTFLIWASSDYGLPTYLRIDRLPALDNEIVEVLALFVIAYVLGHILFVVSSVLDPIYDNTYRRWNEVRVAPFLSRAAAVQKLLDARAVSHGTGMGILEWCRGYLLVNSAAGSQETQGVEGASKFFRSLTITFVVIAILDAWNGRCDHLAMSLAIATLAVWRYATLRLKYTRLVYSLVPHVALAARQGQHPPDVAAPERSA